MNDKEIITLYLIVNAREQVVKCAYTLDAVKQWFSDSFIHYCMVGLKFNREQYKVVKQTKVITNEEVTL